MKPETFWTGRPNELNEMWTDREELAEYRKVMLGLIESELEINPGITVTDCGAGTGLVYRYLEEEFRPRYRGFDFTSDMVEFCKESFPEAQAQFNQVDLTTPNLRKIRGDLLITQNVIQHILMWQEAIGNIMRNAKHGVIFCERTHKGQTLIAGYEPAYRWRFNIKDLYDVLEYYRLKYNYQGRVEILGHPLTTFDEPDMLTVFRVYREREDEGRTLLMSDFERVKLQIDAPPCTPIRLLKKAWKLLVGAR